MLSNGCLGTVLPNNSSALPDLGCLACLAAAVGCRRRSEDGTRGSASSSPGVEMDTARGSSSGRARRIYSTHGCGGGPGSGTDKRGGGGRKEGSAGVPRVCGARAPAWKKISALVLPRTYIPHAPAACWW